MKKTTRLPTRQEIDELLEYLPVFSNTDFHPVLTWHGGNINENGATTIPYPEYDPLIHNFLRIASKECWLDYGYDPTTAGKLLRDQTYVKNCSLEQVKSLLTYFIRGERFMDGFWESMIQEGHIQRIMERIAEIRSQLR